jgi:hypothetical protein
MQNLGCMGGGQHMEGPSKKRMLLMLAVLCAWACSAGRSLAHP